MTEGITQSYRCIHTPGEFAKKFLLYVQEVGRLESLQPHKCIRENLDSFLLFIVLEGSGNLNIHGELYHIKKGDCAFIDCMEHYEHISNETDAWKLAWVHFNGNAARGYYDLFLEYNNNKNIAFVGNVEPWNDGIEGLLDSLQEKNIEAELKCGEQIISLLNRLIFTISGINNPENEQDKQIVSDVRELLNKCYAELNVIDYVEHMLGKKINELDSQFYKQYGITIEQYVENRQLNAAKELLRFSIKPNEEIAVEVGLFDVEKMQLLFQREEKMTADEYRAKWAGWVRN